MSSFEQDCLNAHNAYRAQHGCPPLVLDNGLCKLSTDWAEHLARTNSMQHRPSSSFGENIFMAGGRVVQGSTAVTAWYDEMSQYNFNRPGFSSSTGHFTQVVWKSSKKLGVGIAKRGSSTWVVANYDPPGNFQGQYVDNVPRK